MSVTKLGESIFNCALVDELRFSHYCQQINHVMQYAPKTLLELGPGEHTVTDFLRRKGIDVETYDNDPGLSPTYLGDIRQPFKTEKQYDMVLASEVFEHMNVKYLPQALLNIKKVLKPGGVLIVSLPYTTLRFSPPSPQHGGFISCAGRIRTYIPMYIIFRYLRPIHILYRLLIKRTGVKNAFDTTTAPEYPDDAFNVHHWDLGLEPTTRPAVRKLLSGHFTLLDEKYYPNTNGVFFALKNDK